MEAKQSTKTCAGCGSPILERNRYYTGKFMTARDFQGEQDYGRNRRELHNRLLHGWGVVCGLEVRPHPRSECRNSAVVVKAGVAIDCCGREVIVPEDVVFDVPRTKTAGSQPAEAPQADRQQEGEAGYGHGGPAHEALLLCLFYSEELIEMTPSLYTDGGAGSTDEEANRVRESFSFKLLRRDDVSPECWEGGRKRDRARDDCSDQVPGPAGACLEPDCPCKGGVPLALLTFAAERDEDPVAIHAGGRRHLPVNPDFLTHIVKTNWEHGGQMSLSHLRHELKGRLEITFDRKIRPTAENRALGVSEFTFSVQFGDVQAELRFLPYAFPEPPRLEEDYIAVFQIDPRYLAPESRDDLKDKVVYISLKCDFIIDCRGLAVDGSHVGGTLPTHGGRAGGTFESWFYVRGDHEHEHKRPQPEPYYQADPNRQTHRREQ